MPPNLRFVNTSIVIAGQEIPIESWRVTLSNQGSMATAHCETSLSMLADSGVDVVALSQTPAGAAFDMYAGFDGGDDLLFSGVLDECEGDEGKDCFTISGRDYAAVLADGIQTVSGLSYKNQTVGQIATQIANKFGLKPNVTDPGVLAGPTMNGENSFNPRPQTFWSLLQKMADDVGYECYVTPDQTLYFGPEQNQGTVNMSWMQTGTQTPLLDLKWKYNPRNNSNITVKVISQDPNNTQQVIGQATANSVPVAGSKTKSGKQLVPKISKSGSKGGSGSLSSQKSVYYINAYGMSAQAAQAKAESVARDLAKRQIIIECCLEGLASLKVHSHISLSSGLFLDGLDFNVAEVTHSYSMSEGYMTEFRALALVNQ